MFRLGRIPSILLIVAYLGVTLYFRFEVEPQLHNNPLISMALGAFGLLFIWALIKSGFLNPGWFSWEKETKAQAAKA